MTKQSAVAEVEDTPDEGVVHFWAAVIREAWRAADTTARLRANVRGQEAKQPVSPPVPLPVVVAHPVHDRLRDLGAALRFAHWDKAGLTEFLPADVPTASEAIDRARKAGRDEGTDVPGKLAEEQLDIWLRHFAWDAPEILGADVVKRDDPASSDEFVDRLAEFLWNHRHELPNIENK
jgi:hypothetical protein